MDIKTTAQECFNIAVDHGFYDDGPSATDPTFALSRLMLVTTEVAEAAEDVRHDRWKCFGEELADIVIRVFDMAVFHGVDIQQEIADKMAVNRARPYKHGKNS